MRPLTTTTLKNTGRPAALKHTKTIQIPNSMKQTLHTLIALLTFMLGMAQPGATHTITGTVPLTTGEVRLTGYTEHNNGLLATSTINPNGQFSLSYPAQYHGAALLTIKEAAAVLLLDREDFAIQWSNLSDHTTLTTTGSKQNETLRKGMELYAGIESKRSALLFLKPLYEGEPAQQQWLTKELGIQDKAFDTFLAGLPAGYARYYLGLRKFISDIPAILSRDIAQLPQHEKEFNSMDFADERLTQSGLFKELFEGYYLMMESAGNNMEARMNRSTDAVLKSLSKKPELKQLLAEELFKLFEKRSLFAAAEHLALAMLNDSSCQLDDKHQALFEQYRKMAVGKTAPDITLHNTANGTAKLSSIPSKYKLIVFGASWCPTCATEIPKLKQFANSFKNDYDAEIVFVSLDRNPEDFKAFTKDFPFTSSCDYKEWESQAVIDYCVFATPSMFLLDNDNTILLKPVSPEQVKAWLEFKGVKKTQ